MTANIMITLTDAEAEFFAELAGQWQTTPTQVLEAFVADLTESTRSGGSDERMFARDWFLRCTAPDFGDQPARFLARVAAREAPAPPSEERMIIDELIPDDSERWPVNDQEIPGTVYRNAHRDDVRCIGCGTSHTPLNDAGRCLPCKLKREDQEG